MGGGCSHAKVLLVLEVSNMQGGLLVVAACCSSRRSGQQAL